MRRPRIKRFLASLGFVDLGLDEAGLLAWLKELG